MIHLSEDNRPPATANAHTGFWHRDSRLGFAGTSDLVASDFRLLNGCTAVIFVAVLVQRLEGARCGGWTPLDSDTKLFNEYRRTSDAKVVETRCERQLHAVDQTVLPNPFAFHAAMQLHRGKLTEQHARS